MSEQTGRYTDDEKAKMIKLHGAGSSWVEIGVALGRSPEGLQRTAHRMRGRGEWEADADSVRELPRGPGRPANRQRPAKVSPRLSRDVSTAIRHVAAYNDMRLGQFAVVAVQRYLATHALTAKVRKAAGKAAGECEVAASEDALSPLNISPREEVNSFSILAVDHAAVTRIAQKRKAYPASIIAEALHCLLADLGYTLEKVQ